MDKEASQQKFLPVYQKVFTNSKYMKDILNFFVRRGYLNVGVLFSFHPSWNTCKQVLICHDLMHYWQCVLQLFLQVTHLQTFHCIRKRSELSLRTFAGKVFNDLDLQLLLLLGYEQLSEYVPFITFLLLNQWKRQQKTMLTMNVLTNRGQYPFFRKIWTCAVTVHNQLSLRIQRLTFLIGRTPIVQLHNAAVKYIVSLHH